MQSKTSAYVNPEYADINLGQRHRLTAYYSSIYILPIFIELSYIHCSLNIFERVVYANDLFLFCSRRVLNDLSLSLFLRGVRLRPALLNKIYRADEGTLVLYMYLMSNLVTTGYLLMPVKNLYYCNEKNLTGMLLKLKCT